MSTARPEPEPASTLVIGVGNDGLRDEGVGLRTVQALAERPLGAHVRVLEGGTEGLGLLDRLEGARHLVLVDAMEMGRPPGTVVTVRREEIRARTPADRTSLHGMGLLEALDVAEAVGLLPAEVHIVGVQPAVVAPGFDLSPEVQAALPRAVEAVLSLVQDGGDRRRPTADS